MASPFPGMDPYLEARTIWPGFHHSLAEELKRQLNPLLGPKYYADVETRTVLQELGVSTTRTMYPDASVLEDTRPTAVSSMPLSASAVVIPQAPVRRTVLIPGRTRLRAVRVYTSEGSRLVTSIEILSPINKHRGEGLENYRFKRARILQSPVHLVEIDLLRAGQRPGWELADAPLDTDYVLLVNRASDVEERVSEIWPVALNESLPVLPIPLLAPDPDVALDLGVAIANIYELGNYRWRIDYTDPVPPPELRPAIADWLARELPHIGGR